MNDLNKWHPTSNLILIGHRINAQHELHIYWSDYVLFTASPLSNWRFGLDYNSLPVSHIPAQETSTLIRRAHPCYCWKGTTDAPRGQPRVNDHTPHWILPHFFDATGPTGVLSETSSCPRHRGGGLSGLACTARHPIRKVPEHHPFIFMPTSTDIVLRTSISHTAAAVSWLDHLSKAWHRSPDQRQTLMLHKIQVVHLSVWCAKAAIGYPIFYFENQWNQLGLSSVCTWVCVCMYHNINSRLLSFGIPPSHT